MLNVSELQELGEANSDDFRREVRSAWPDVTPKAIEIDLSSTVSIDSWGLGALIAVQKWAHEHNGNGALPVRLVNPLPPVQHILEVTRLHRTFEIVKR